MKKFKRGTTVPSKDVVVGKYYYDSDYNDDDIFKCVRILKDDNILRFEVVNSCRGVYLKNHDGTLDFKLDSATWQEAIPV